MAVIDAHHHFWKTALQEQPWRSEVHSALERDFEPSDLVPELENAGVDATVVMQSVDESAENDRLAMYARQPRVAGIVAWLPIRDQNEARDELDRIDVEKLCGVRCLIARDPLDWLTEHASIELFRHVASRGLAWDVVPITIEQTRRVIELAHAVPELRIVVDHLGRPPLDTGEWEPWATHIRQLAACPSVAMKLSVGIDALTAWERWDPDVLDPYVSLVCEQFGAERVMLASNWPVVLLRASYERAWRDLSALAERHFTSPEGRANVFGGTAERWYNLGAIRQTSEEAARTTA